MKRENYKLYFILTASLTIVLAIGLGYYIFNGANSLKMTGNAISGTNSNSIMDEFKFFILNVFGDKERCYVDPDKPNPYSTCEQPGHICKDDKCVEGCIVRADCRDYWGKDGGPCVNEKCVEHKPDLSQAATNNLEDSANVKPVSVFKTVFVCSNNSDCHPPLGPSWGTICTDNAKCVPGCFDATDCDYGSDLGACDQNIGEYGQCVQCTDDSDCRMHGDDYICDQKSDTCVINYIPQDEVSSYNGCYDPDVDYTYQSESEDSTGCYTCIYDGEMYYWDWNGACDYTSEDNLDYSDYYDAGNTYTRECYGNSDCIGIGLETCETSSGICMECFGPEDNGRCVDDEGYGDGFECVNYKCVYRA